MVARGLPMICVDLQNLRISLRQAVGTTASTTYVDGEGTIATECPAGRRAPHPRTGVLPGTSAASA